MEKADIRGKEPAWTVERWVNRQIDFKTAQSSGYIGSRLLAIETRRDASSSVLNEPKPLLGKNG
jgi:hypothetical protein